MSEKTNNTDLWERVYQRIECKQTTLFKALEELGMSLKDFLICEVDFLICEVLMNKDDV